MGKMRTKLYHLKVGLFGDKELENEGKIIPCKKCDTPFKSYRHYDTYLGFGYVYDSLCKNCNENGSKK